MVRADLPRAIAIGTRMLTLAEQEGSRDKILQAHRIQGLARLLTGDHDKAGWHYGEVLRRYDPVAHDSHRFRYGSDPAAVVRAQWAWSDCIRGNFARSERNASEGALHARKLDHAHSIVHAVGVDALRLLTAREFARSAAAVDEARAQAEKHEFPYWIAWCNIIAAAIQRPADPGHALELLSPAIDGYRRTGVRQLVPYALALEAECCLDLDRPHDAMRVLDEALALTGETGVVLYAAELLRLRACAAHRMNRNHRDADLERSLALARNQGAELFSLRALATVLEYSHSRQTRDQVKREIGEVLAERNENTDTAELRGLRRLMS